MNLGGCTWRNAGSGRRYGLQGAAKRVNGEKRVSMEVTSSAVAGQPRAGRGLARVRARVGCAAGSAWILQRAEMATAVVL